MSSGRYEENLDGIEVIRYPERIFILEAPILPQIVLRLVREKYDILHVHGMVPTLTDFALLVGKLKRKPVILTYHYDAQTNRDSLAARIANAVYPATIRFLLPKWVDRAVATSKSYALTSTPIQSFGEKLRLIPCGVGEDVERWASDDDPIRIEDGLLDCRRVLYAGKLIKYKGVRYLLEAVAQAREVLPDIRLEIIGDGKERAELEALTRKLGIESSVEFRGWLPRSELVEAYRKTDVFVLPSIGSRREAFGIVVLEAMAMGKPVVVSDIPGPRSVVDDGVDGILVPPAEPSKLAEAIVYLFQNPAVMESMASKGRRKIGKFGWDSIAQQYESLYGEVLLERSRLHVPPEYQSVQQTVLLERELKVTQRS